MSFLHAVFIIFVVAAVTFLTRLTPFALFTGKRQPPESVRYLGKILPYAVMAILVVYCLKSTVFTSVGGFLPQLIAVAVVVVLHVAKRNNLLSICAGTAVYMLLIQFVFV
ncbi:MAG: AzlD domain-containing protein [Oscillospiraceae bacterium]